MVKTGLILGGGGTRGIAHIGALKVFERLNITFDVVAGCSIGAIIGAMYCAGKKSDEIEEFIKKNKMSKILDLSISKKGIYKTKKLAKELKKFIGVDSFEELKVPLYINAVNIHTGKEKVFSSGNLIDAVMASIAIPGIFHPFKKDNNYYVDGGVLNQNPISILPRKIKRYVIINVSSFNKRKMNLSMFNVLQKSLFIMQEELSMLKIRKLNKKNYVMIEPEVSGIAILNMQKNYNEIINKGEKATIKKKKELANIRKSAFKRLITKNNNRS